VYVCVCVCKIELLLCYLLINSRIQCKNDFFFQTCSERCSVKFKANSNKRIDIKQLLLSNERTLFTLL